MNKPVFLWSNTNFANTAIAKRIAVFVSCFLAAFLSPAGSTVNFSYGQNPPSENPKVRELLVPFEDLPIILNSQAQRVFMTREEYADLLARSKKSTETAPPQNVAFIESKYQATIDDGRATIQGQLTLDVLSDGLNAIPLTISGVGVQSAEVDGQPASLAINEQGQIVIFVEGKGQKQFVLKMLAPIASAAAQQSLHFHLPVAGASTFDLQVPGNVEIKSGAQVTTRTVDQDKNLTLFGIVLEPRPMSIVMTLNNRSLREQQVVVAKSILVDEMTLGYEKLHANMSMSVLHGAADRYRFALPDGFEISEVLSQSMARWSIQEVDGKRTLEVFLRAPQSEKEGLTEVVQVTAFRPAKIGQDWQFPKITPIDVQGNIAIVGILAEERIISESIQAKDLISIDNSVLRSALPESIFRAEPNAPAIRPIVAYYAPQAEYELATRFREQKTEQRVTTNLMLVANDRGLEIHGGFAILAVNDKLFHVELSAPLDWHVSSITLPDGTALPFENRVEEGERRLHIVFPTATPAGQTQNLLLTGQYVPQGWLSDWTEQQIPFPRFFAKGMSQDIGACAVQVADDLIARPVTLEGLTVLNENEKIAFQLADVQTSLAYRYDSQPWNAVLRIERQSPRITAKSFAFFKIEPEGLAAHYEVNFTIDQASTQRLEFSLPDSTPSEVSIRGLDSLSVKETTSRITDGRRIWTVLLAQRQSGLARLAVAFLQPLATQEPKEWSLPTVRAENVAFQSGMIAVEGHAELDTEVKTHPRRVDIGELVDAEYSVGRRLLGAFGFVGNDATVIVDVSRRAGHALPTTIAELTELVSVVSRNGTCQTIGRFRLKTKAQFLQVQLPDGAELWSMLLDGQPALPQRDRNRLVVDLPANNNLAYRELQVVYESQVSTLDTRGQIQMPSPTLLVPVQNSDLVTQVPMADLKWHLFLPHGYQVTQSDGSVFTSISHQSPINWLAGFLYELGGGVALQRTGSVALQRRKLAPASGTLRSLRNEQLSLNMDHRPQGFPNQQELSLPVPGEESQDQIVPEFTQPADQPQVAQPQAPAQQPAPPQAPAAIRPMWALEGLRSLDIDLAIPSGAPTIFRSFGVEPELRATVVRHTTWTWLAAAVGLAAFSASLYWMFASVSFKIRWVSFLVFLGLILPSVTPWPQESAATSQALLSAAIASALVFLITAFRIRSSRDSSSKSSSAIDAKKAVPTFCLIFMLISASNNVVAQPPAVEKPEDILKLLNTLVPDQPLMIPEDAIVVPFDPSEPIQSASMGKILVPYAAYVQLWNQAYPDKRLTEKPLPADYAIRGAIYTTNLNSDETLEVEGRIGIELFADKDVAIPLAFGGGVLARAEVDGKPARVAIATAPQPDAAQQQATINQSAEMPTGSLFVLHLSGKGQKEFTFSMRFKLERRGGWRVAEGRLPPVPSSQLDLTVPLASTDVRLRGVTDRSDRLTTEDGQRIETALGTDGNFGIQWRPKISEANVDQGLTAESIAVLDVQENGLRLAWRAVFEFRRGRRDSFTAEVPKDYFVEKVVGDNVRGWVTKNEGESQLLEVTLLDTASERETLTFYLAKNQAIGQQDWSRIDTPAIRFPDAMLQQGTITIRRSLLLEIRADEVKGMNRIEAVDDAAMAFVALGSSPLPLKSFQSYRFQTPAFQLGLAIQAIKPRVQVTSQSLLKVSPRELLLESQVSYQVQDRPIHRLRVSLPLEYEILQPTVPGSFEWFVQQQADAQILEIQLAEGLINDVAIIIRASARRRNPADGTNPGTIALPRLQILDVDRQQGTIVVQADPSFDIRAEQLQNCEVVKLAQSFAWLAEQQRSLARIAIEFRQPDYSAQLTVARRQSVVQAIAITNVKVTERAIEETVLLDWKIRDSGIQRVSFVLPYWMWDARISAPMVREIIKTPVNDQSNADIRFQLELQDEVINEYRVVLENDRQLSLGEKIVPIPTIETGTTDRRYVTLENAGRDEIVTKQLNGIEPLDRQQAEWRSLSNLLGGKAAQAFLVRETGQSPSLIYDTTERAEVETAGARIGLARTLLVVDEMGTYRGLQEYRVENRTEQFLEIELPQGAEMWTAIVADEPVKPMVVAGNSKFRIPLVKTAEGDLDYGVYVKYGGHLDSFRATSEVRFPLIRTVNVRAELSQVRLRLPDSLSWYGFGGSMGRVLTEADLNAGWLSFKTKQVEQLTEMLRKSTTKNAFSKARAATNLKQLGAELREQSQTFQSASPQSVELRSQVMFNDVAIKQAEDLLAGQSVDGDKTDANDNRSAINKFYEVQGLQNSVNVVNSLGGNFDMSKIAPNEAPGKPGADFDASGFQNYAAGDKVQKLEGRVIEESGKDGKELSEKSPSKAKNPDATKLNQRGLKGDAKNDMAPIAEKKLDDLESQVSRYRSKLESVQNSRRAGGMGGQGQQRGFSSANDANQSVDPFGDTSATTPSNLPMPPGGAPMQGGTSDMYAVDDRQFNPPSSALGGGGRASELFSNRESDEQTAGLSSTRNSPQYGQLPPAGFGVSPFGAWGGLGTRAGGEPDPNNREFQGGQTEGMQLAPNRMDGTLASLDIEIPIRGQEFLFTTPGNEIELTARSFSKSLTQRLTDIGIALGVLIGIWVVARIVRAIASYSNGRRFLIAMLAIASVISMVFGAFPVYGLLGIILAIALAISQWLKARHLKSSPAGLLPEVQ